MELFFSGLTSVLLLAAFVLVIGIVWRVEAELDTAYKYFSLAVVFSFLHEIIVVWPVVHELAFGNVLIIAIRFLAALMLFLGMYYMRDLVRRMDGEK